MDVYLIHPGRINGFRRVFQCNEWNYVLSFFLLTATAYSDTVVPREKRSFGTKVLHSHPVGELLKCLTVEGDGYSCISVEGELHTVLNLWFSAFFHWCVRVVFIPAIRRFEKLLDKSSLFLLWFLCRHVVSCDLYLTKRKESFLMLTRLLRVFTGSWGAGVTYGN